MSRLRELRLHGFKSFADPTRFVFEPGVNAVLGPNGSGKSNMADAVRWVLGEQSNRSLRTRRADDVIFAGSEQRKPLGMAEAVLTLDNADGWLPIDFAEVSIGRRAYRSGEGEYLINGARARLRDVVELLGSGRLGANELVVVGQGTVDAALSLRPEERRQLFEEAAGVKGLHVKRNEASGRLTRAADNLTRVTDLVAELKPQVRRLALQAEHQQQHDALGARALALVTESYGRRERATRSALGEARRAAAAADGVLQAFRASQDAERQATAAAEARYWEAEEQAREAARAREGTREGMIRLEGRLEALDGRVADATAQLDRGRAELEALEAAEPEARNVPDTDLEAALAAARRAEAAWRAATAELAAADERLIAAEEAVASLRARESDRIAAAARSSEEEARQAVRREQAAADRQAATTELEAARGRAAAAEDTMTLAAERGRTAAEALDVAEDARDRAQAAADAATQALLAVEERIRAGRAELEALADPADGARRLSRRLAGAGWRLLLDSLGAADEAWPAIEAVVGGELEAALLWSGDDPADQLDGARGSARLLAATGAEEPSATARAQALEAVAGERTLAEWLAGPEMPAAFRRTVVARDVRTLLGGWDRLPEGWCAVTRDGDLADARGVITLRGRDDAARGAAARAHVRRRELAATIEDLERRAGEAQRVAHAASEELRLARATHLAAAEAADDAQRQVRLAREDAPARQADVRRLVERLGSLDDELAALAAPSETEGRSEQSLGLAALQSAADEARAARDAIAERRDETRARWSAAREAAEAAEAAAPLSGGVAVRAARLAQLHASLPVLQRAVHTLAAERSELASALDAARQADEQAAARVTAADAGRGSRREELLALERRQVDAGGRLADLERAAQSTAIEASRRDEALVTLARERELALESLPQVDPSVEGSMEPEDDLAALADDALEAELRRVRRTLGQIGSVNPFAVEEHRDLAGRLDEMTAQESDLRGAIAATEELIARLDAEIAQQFDTAFKAIGARFDEFCRLLFAGGSGSLSVGDAEDGDEPNGIEIVVRPPGKRLQRLSMLSGGERALTGVALLFAMLSVNPVPFCILDEVDAALDEANIGRFAQALRRLSESIDFVVITHNRATIEVADTIYGVTMTDAAVSRVLSLRLADLPAEVVA